MAESAHPPNPVRWVGYAFGAGLPARHREWVLHDVSTRTWALRHFGRTTVQLVPIAIALYVLIPGPSWVRGAAVLAGLILGFFYSAAYMFESTEHRVVKAGYPYGAAAAHRTDPSDDEERRRRYEERWRGGS